MDWTSGLNTGAKKLFSSDSLQKIYEALTKASELTIDEKVQIALDQQEIRELMRESFRAGLDLGQALIARRMATQKIYEAQEHVANLIEVENLLAGLDSSSNQPPVEVQNEIANGAYIRAADAVNRAGEYFFVLRRAVERDTVPANPQTGLSGLTTYEEDPLAGFHQYPECQAVTTSSLDINFLNEPCFERRVEVLKAFYTAYRNQELVLALDEADTTFPKAAWMRNAADDGYVIPIDIDLAKAHGVSASHAAQKLEDIKFFLPSTDPTAVPAPVHVSLSRGTEDVYWVGTRSGTVIGPVNVFETFSREQGSNVVATAVPFTDFFGSGPTITVDANACYAMTSASPDNTFSDTCKLSGLGPTGYGPFVGASLIGSMKVEVKDAELAGRSPDSLVAYIHYRYRVWQPQP